jgi:hypothetical protein
LAIDKDRDSTTCLPNSQLRTAIYLIERGKLDSAKVVLLNARIAIKDSLLAIGAKTEESYKVTIASYEKELALVDDALKELNAQIAKLELALKRQKKKTVWVAILSAAGTATLFILVNK